MSERNGTTGPTSDEAAPREKAGIFDIRFVIGGLIGAYGIILVLLGLFNATDAELDRGDGLNINLWSGLGMLVVAIAFGVWARLRPVVVPVEKD
jgi:membrane-bound ClpP family serine protease